MKQLQIVIPMAGLGSRFVNEGFSIPKPILPIGKLRMIEVVINNLATECIEKLVILTTRKIMEDSNLRELLAKYAFKVEIILVDKITDGPASTCFLALPHVDLDKPLVIANSDQYLDTDMNLEYSLWDPEIVDGVIWAMEDNSSKWSYVRANKENLALEVREKVVISNLATCGVYGFSNARDFFEAYDQMVKFDDRTNNEFYVAPTYNYLIDKGRKIVVRNLGEAGNVMHGLGVPEDYLTFLDSGIPEKLGIAN